MHVISQGWNATLIFIQYAPPALSLGSSEAWKGWRFIIQSDTFRTGFWPRQHLNMQWRGVPVSAIGWNTPRPSGSETEGGNGTAACYERSRPLLYLLSHCLLSAVRFNVWFFFNTLVFFPDWCTCFSLCLIWIWSSESFVQRYEQVKISSAEGEDCGSRKYRGGQSQQ